MSVPELMDVMDRIQAVDAYAAARGRALDLVGSLAATHLLKSVLFEVSPNDPVTFGWVAGTLLGVSLLASYIPARRVSRVDPQVALRAE